MNRMMKLSLSRFITALATSACILAIPLQAQAHHLAISNNTPNQLSFSVNNTCSEDFGTVSAYDIKTISEETLNRVCANYASTCEIIGYDEKNCSGKPLGGLRYLSEHSFDVFSGGGKISVTATESSLFYNSPIARK